MLPGRYKNAIVISKIPVIQAGLRGIILGHLPDHELTFCRSVEELTLLQLRCTELVLVDLTGESNQPRAVCEQFYALLTQYNDIKWIFIIPHKYYPSAVEILTGPSTTLLSDEDPVESVVNAIRSGNYSAEHISKELMFPVLQDMTEYGGQSMVLTLSERKVLRLLGKGWGINQIASLLKKSNKTISAQKNSAMRRLSIHSNAEMYAWINSSQGARELNLPSAYGDTTEWKKESSREMLRW
ncbi:helix-turn-helix transcriptional regulator [Citrobacter sp. NCU1]|uniref:helix-turn-helix domain-containing protein n=1 Tax=Citrobacter sp. NCU1 TaxID=2026683 RepID=UPI001391A7F3|nr:LuxR C-terminal-related transcriptional regulator [Citrobacter sp. NCU1]NDO81218.1 helix-turn-helix transcriptional regulator [Citrobacter sp. NCU1]